jgi:asparagine synthetase B (glutamine-hydrolysing)
MFFYYEHIFSNEQVFNFQVIDDNQPLSNPGRDILYIKKEKQYLVNLSFSDKRLLLIGDPVFDQNIKLSALLSTKGELVPSELIETVRGHYNWFFINGHDFYCGSSFGAIFPVYYAIRSSGVVICSSSLFLANALSVERKDRKNLLERLLFNYPLFGSTWWKELKLLDTHHCLSLSDSAFKVTKYLSIEEYFGSVQYRNRKALNHLVDLFGEETQRFFPDELFAVSFTGGFDGRTLVAAAMQSKKEFFTYSFGKPGVSDIEIPAQHSKKIGINYDPIYLDEKYVNEDAFNAALAFSHLTEYNGNLHRPHYQYAVKHLSKKVDFMITGNFGSELFRALHNPGVMMSESLIDIFSSPNNAWKDKVINKVQSWEKDLFKDEVESIIEDIDQYLTSLDGMSLNHRFYVFVYSEIFRKYFGPEILMQSHYLNNRTPFLNLHFIRALNKTLWSGVHAQIFEKKKVQRMKGQIFYSAFIKKSCPALYYLKTSKGYSPADVFEPSRLPVLIAGFLNKKYLGRPEVDDNADGVFFVNHHKQLLDEFINRFDENLKPFFIRGNRDIEAGENIEYWLKMYSIAMGWSSHASAISV